MSKSNVHQNVFIVIGKINNTEKVLTMKTFYDILFIVNELL